MGQSVGRIGEYVQDVWIPKVTKKPKPAPVAQLETPEARGFSAGVDWALNADEPERERLRATSGHDFATAANFAITVGRSNPDYAERFWLRRDIAPADSVNPAWLAMFVMAARATIAAAKKV